MLLASNPEWQQRVRTEVLEICADQMPDADMVRKMKTVSIYILISVSNVKDTIFTLFFFFFTSLVELQDNKYIYIYIHTQRVRKMNFRCLN